MQPGSPAAYRFQTPEEHSRSDNSTIMQEYKPFNSSGANELILRSQRYPKWWTTTAHTSLKVARWSPKVARRTQSMEKSWQGMRWSWCHGRIMMGASSNRNTKIRVKELRPTTELIQKSRMFWQQRTAKNYVEKVLIAKRFCMHQINKNASCTLGHVTIFQWVHRLLRLEIRLEVILCFIMVMAVRDRRLVLK